ncbi:protein methyltransferase [Aaosphaeria arxii CBS 175.79]|uniref:Protein methyltransferase n=1 Tax=Aaosphaeria arxii CBS 175.79 TaxID=1450172 RepID=A0A6A5XLU6_9PLEO|nr:protein methyltransferase [Aaosphaeria arxii CBS 175.79]KAF2013839.1 protein methyltransferase [Aaosphaeria arxii CBS 175.79]
MDTTGASGASNSHIPLLRCADLMIITDTPKGRGVFASKNIPAKTILDVSPVLVLGQEENVKHIEHTSLYHYTYNWPIVDKDGQKKVAQAVIFGLGSMFNHSLQDQNVVWERDAERLIVTYRTLHDVKAGEELCISYGSHLTFKDADAVVAPPTESDGIHQLNQIQLD